MEFLPGWYVATALFVFGAAFGSFANVVIHRVPRGISIVHPGSRCPHCEADIRWFDNIPIASFFVLRGRCRNCGNPFGVRYLLVELITAVLWVVVGVRFDIAIALPIFLLFTTVLVMVSVVDLDTRRIPNRLLAPAGVVAAVLIVLASAVSGEWPAAGKALIGGAAFSGSLLILALAVPGGMGMGDVKLAGYLGLHLGWLGLMQVMLGALLGFLIGGVVSVLLVVTRRKGRKDTLPFGPFLALGAVMSVLWGDVLIHLWLGV